MRAPWLKGSLYVRTKIECPWYLLGAWWPASQPTLPSQRVSGELQGQGHNHADPTQNDKAVHLSFRNLIEGGVNRSQSKANIVPTLELFPTRVPNDLRERSFEVASNARSSREARRPEKFANPKRSCRRGTSAATGDHRRSTAKADRAGGRTVPQQHVPAR